MAWDTIPIVSPVPTRSESYPTGGMILGSQYMTSISKLRKRTAWCILVLFAGLGLWLYWPADPALAILRAGGTVDQMTLPRLKGRIAITLPDTVGDEDLERMTALDRLRPVFVQLRGRQITGRGLASLKRLPELYGLVLWGTSITDDDLLTLSAFPDLTILNLDANQLSARALEHLKNLPALRAVSVRRTGLPADAVRQFQAEHPKIIVGSEFTDKADDD
jgi:hypothetical protein